MSDLNHKNTLLIGIGNSGRQDDGLGWAFVETIEKSGIFNGEMQLRYQLQIEDADLACQFERVVFVDAFEGGLPSGFEWKKCLPAKEFAFSTHELAPATILYLCGDLYDKIPNAHLLMIEGVDWGMEIGLSEKAKGNLAEALKFFEEKLTVNSESAVVG